MGFCWERKKSPKIYCNITSFLIIKAKKLFLIPCEISENVLLPMHCGGLAKWLQYYIGVVWQMITVLHGGGVSNDYGTPWILGCYIRNINSRDLKKIKFLSVGKKSFLGGMSKWLQLYRGGVRRNDYSITIPYNCHFFYTDTIFVRIKFTPKNADFSR